MNDKFAMGTGQLFALPSFLSGAARALDLGGTFDRYNTSPSEDEADICAMQSDWMVVGGDMKKAIEKNK